MEQTLKKLGKYLVEQGFTPEHITEVFKQSDEYYEPIMFVDDKLEKAIADFCSIEGIEFTEFLGTFKAEELF